MLDKFIKKNERRRKNVLISIETLASDRHSEEDFASYDSSKKKMEVKKNYLAHSIISAVRPKSFVSTFHHATGLYINRKSGSKLIVNLLSNLGVCASYYDVALHETSAIKAEVTQITPPVFAQYVYDNADHNAQTEVNQDDDDNDDNFLEDQSSEEILPDSEIVIRPGYLKIMQGIYGSYSDDDNEDTEDEDDNSTTEQAYEVPNSLPSTSDDQPISKRRRNK
ncbi:hypothetical protein JTB14_003409 [Gonioctena quinquepunctata]|nr:hypothetical protein JTB14_003409 [Gonioctena quinquepunctata]